MSTARSKGGTPIGRPCDYHPYRIQGVFLGTASLSRACSVKGRPNFHSINRCEDSLEKKEMQIFHSKAFEPCINSEFAELYLFEVM
jgi:hypothetical protein